MLKSEFNKGKIEAEKLKSPPDKEGDSLYLDNLKQQSRISTHNIKEGIKKKLSPSLSYMFLLFLWFTIIIIVATFSTIVWHRLMPTDLRWLNGDDIKSLETVAFSGTISSFITIALSKLRNL